MPFYQGCNDLINTCCQYANVGKSQFSCMFGQCLCLPPSSGLTPPNASQCCSGAIGPNGLCAAGSTGDICNLGQAADCLSGNCATATISALSAAGVGQCG